MDKVAKKRSVVGHEKIDRKYCGYSKALKLARKAYNKALRAHNRNVCRDAKLAA